MRLLLVCSILHQLYGIFSTPEVKLKFYKNVKVNDSLLNEIHRAVLAFKPIDIRHINTDIQEKELLVNDNVTKFVMNNHPFTTIKHKFKTILTKYEKYAIKKGQGIVSSIPYYLAKQLHKKEDELPQIKNVSKNFSEKAYQYFRNISKENYKTNIDKEFMLLNTVQTFNDLLFDEEINLINYLIFQSNVNLTKGTLITIMEHFYQELKENKRDDMEYLCFKLNICRPFLGFTEYIGDIIREPLKLSDAKLTDFFMKLSIPIKDQSEFFKSILGDASALEIGLKLEDSIFRDVSRLRKVLWALRAYLAKRYAFVKSVDEEKNLINKALRILMDIIDKSFDVNGDELLAVHFDLLLKTIKYWSRGQTNEIEKIFKAFIDQAVEIMKNNLSEEGKLEIKALIDVLMKKVDKGNEVYRYLFIDGSKFVRGEDITSKLSLL